MKQLIMHDLTLNKLNINTYKEVKPRILTIERQSTTKIGYFNPK